MGQADKTELTPPTLEYQKHANDPSSPIRLLGDWSIHSKVGSDKKLKQQLTELSGRQSSHTWDLTDIENLDSVGAMLLWHAWDEKMPDNIQMCPSEQASFDRLKKFHTLPKQKKSFDILSPVAEIGKTIIAVWEHFLDIVALIGMLLIQAARTLSAPSRFPALETSANIYHAGFQALGINALVGAMIGVAISYLLALQLLKFGANTFIIPILGIGIIREIGPLIAAILMAGRSGSSMTAQIGVMRITEEIDALSAMGISPTLRLVLPKVLALIIVTPLLVVWTSIAGLLGGLAASKEVLNIGLIEFLNTIQKEVILQNLWIALLKGATFGLLIGIIACHFGLKIKENTESLSQGTTTSVVAAITTVILVDALYAILLREVGF